MDEFIVLWVDARLKKVSPGMPAELACCRVHAVEDLSALTPAVRLRKPGVIAFDFDFPDLAGLRALQSVKRDFAAIPLLMLTQQVYENLLLWALRMRVWDVLIKPFPASLLQERITALRGQRASANGARNNLMPPPPLPTESRFINPPCLEPHINEACRYIANNLHEKIAEDALARQCGINRFAFSRTFRRELGTTFRNYLLTARLARAKTMLSDTDAAVTDIAFNVGIHDLSHFAALFRRCEGCTPSEYRRHAQKSRSAQCS